MGGSVYRALETRERTEKATCRPGADWTIRVAMESRLLTRVWPIKQLQSPVDVIFTARRCASAVYAVVVCLSACLSVRPHVTRPYCFKTAKRRITQTTPHDSPGTLVYDVKNLGENKTESPPIGAPNAGEVG